MYVWGRFLRTALTTRSRGSYRLGEESTLSFRCLPTDIDGNLHLNNARYMMLADMGRIDIFIRSGFWDLCRRNGWAPMMGGLQAVYVREIRLWQRFHVVSSLETWQDRQMIGAHRFLHMDGTVAAAMLTTAGIYDRANRTFVRADEVARRLGYEGEPRPPTAEEAAFMASHERLRGLARGRLQAGSARHGDAA